MSGINSTRLREKMEEIMTLWEQRSLKEVPSAVKAESLALRNSLPIYLNHLSDALATNRKMDVKSVLDHNLESLRIGKLHGANRAGTASYILTEVIFEYHILREVIFQVLEVDGPLDSIQRDIIYCSIEEAVNSASVKFSEVHADIQSKFVDVLTHDLKTPLTTAKLAAQIILRRSDKPDACIISASKIIVSLDRLNRMIHDLLDSSRVRAGERLSLQFEECDLDTVMREVLDEMIVIHGDQFVIDSDIPMVGNWGSEGLRRALENLVGNAIKYGATDKLVTVSLKKKNDRVELAVHNFGSLITEEEMPNLFQHYGRSHDAQDSRQAGWGLGLTIVRGVVDAHKGTIRVESTPKGGTSFILDLPSPPNADKIQSASF